jgi:hypothetical protein
MPAVELVQRRQEAKPLHLENDGRASRYRINRVRGRRPAALMVHTTHLGQAHPSAPIIARRTSACRHESVQKDLRVPQKCKGTLVGSRRAGGVNPSPAPGKAYLT